MKVGALTIGQAPRDDVAPEFLAAAGPGIELAQAGALDGLDRAEIGRLAPGPGAPILVTRLLDGTEVRLDENLILDRLQSGIARLEEQGARLIVMFCTGEFPEFRSVVPILRPDRILSHFVSAVLPGARVCAVVPAAAQSAMMAAKWARHGLDVTVEALSPYSSTPAEIGEAADRAAAHGCDAVILDCIGYPLAVKAAFAAACRKPVILPRTLLGRAVAELA